MSKIHKVLISIGLVVILILLIRLGISKETVYTVEADVKLYREDPNLKEQELETKGDAIGQEHQTNHNQSSE